MRIRDLNWMQLEELPASDDRIVLPVGSTEQHAYLSLETRQHPRRAGVRRSGRAARRAGAAGGPVRRDRLHGVSRQPDAPRVHAVAVLSDVVDSLLGQGFARVLVVNGHGGNTGPGRDWAQRSSRPDRSFGTSCGRGVRTRSPPRSIPTTTTPRGRRASRGRGFRAWPSPRSASHRSNGPRTGIPRRGGKRSAYGSFGGLYQRSREDEGRLWEAAVQGIRERLERWDERGREGLSG